MSSSGCSSRSSTRTSTPASPRGPSQVGRQIMDEPQVVWCGGKQADQDVSIRLVRSGNQGGIDEQEITDPSSRETLAEVKVHSSRLRKCSKYFATGLSERWAQPNPNPASLEFVLEVHGVEVAIYTNCFSRMYTPFRKQFQDVEHSLKLLQVVNQIEYHDLMSSICGYLSSTMWSGEDEWRIRQFVASPHFPRSHAKDLLARLEMAGSKQDGRKQIFSLIKRCMRSLYNSEVNSSSALVFPTELLKKIGLEEQSVSSTFEKHVVAIINKEANRMLVMLVNLLQECEEYPYTFGEIPGYYPKLRAIHRVLEALLVAEMGDEGVTCFLNLDSYPQILAHVAAARNPQSAVLANEFASLILFMYGEVVAGNLNLGIADRVALLRNWHSLFEKLQMTEKHKVATRALFSTLPFQQQVELLFDDAKPFYCYITPRSLATLLKDRWPAESERAGVEMDFAESDPIDS